MRYVSRKVRFADGREDTACVPLHTEYGAKAETFGGEIVTVIDEAAKQLEAKRSRVIQAPAIGGRTFAGEGYRSKAWGVMPDPESIRKAKEQTPEWDFCTRTGDALIPSQKALESGVKKIKSQTPEEV